MEIRKDNVSDKSGHDAKIKKQDEKIADLDHKNNILKNGVKVLNKKYIEANR